MIERMNEEIAYLNNKIETDTGISSFFLKTELLLVLNRREEASLTIDELCKRIGNRRVGLYETSRYFFWRGLPDYALVFINKALDENVDDEMCLKHKEQLQLQQQGKL